MTTGGDAYDPGAVPSDDRTVPPGPPPGFPPGAPTRGSAWGAPGGFPPHGPRRDDERNRGLDAGLARSCPDPSGLTMTTYRSFRRRVEVYMRCCRRRGEEAVIEGAFLLMQQFGKTAWDACEEISLDELETPRAFDV